MRPVLRALLFCCLIGCAIALVASDSAAQTRTPEAKPPGGSNFVSPGTISGCYQLTLSEWRPKQNLGGDAVFITPPSTVQLLAERGTNGWEASGFVARPAPGVAPTIHRGSYWLPTGPRSIRIVWTTGYSGLEMNLTLEGSGLRGTAESFWDFPREAQTTDVVASKVDCSEKSASPVAQPTSRAPATVQSNCYPDAAEPKIIAGVGWGTVHVGAAQKDVESLLGTGSGDGPTATYLYENFTDRGVQVMFQRPSNTVKAVFFYNGQRGNPEYSPFCGGTDKGINWQSSIDDVKKAYGQPIEEFSGNSSGESWNRIRFDGIDFRFEDGHMVRISVPGK
jgi:hypothetical protein